MCLLAHVVSQCTRLPRTSIRSGRLLETPGALGRLLDRPGVAGRHSDTLGIAGQLLDALGVLGRNLDTPGILGRNIAITQRWSGRLSPENAASVRMSPENENESLEHGSDEPRVKWGFNEWIIQLGAKSGTAPDHIGNRSESNRARSAPNRDPHLTKGPPPKRRALCERFATAYTAREV